MSFVIYVFNECYLSLSYPLSCCDDKNKDGFVEHPVLSPVIPLGYKRGEFNLLSPATHKPVTYLFKDAP